MIPTATKQTRLCKVRSTNFFGPQTMSIRSKVHPQFFTSVTLRGKQSTVRSIFFKRYNGDCADILGEAMQDVTAPKYMDRGHYDTWRKVLQPEHIHSPI